MKTRILVFLILFGLSGIILCAQEKSDALILQELSWAEAEDYFDSNDMIIIPLGSTEQHGPHLPLGTDYYEEMLKGSQADFCFLIKNVR
jgi:hypothetical protein